VLAGYARQLATPTRPAPTRPVVGTQGPTTLRPVEEGTCDSCGAGADDLVEVHRVYLTPADWDREERVEVVEETERWCWPCRTHYPHQELRA
jgi:hypothetical protein